MEKDRILRKVVLEEVVTRDGSTGVYVGSDFDSEEEMVQFIEHFLSAISSRKSTILHGNIQTPFEAKS